MPLLDSSPKRKIACIEAAVISHWWERWTMPSDWYLENGLSSPIYGE